MTDILAGSISDFLDFMPDSVTIYAWVSQSVSGVPTYSGTGTAYPCRIELKNHLVIDQQGREVMARGRVILGSAAVIGFKDKITLPSEYVPTNPPIIAVNVVPDEIGNHHTTIEIG